MIAVIATAATRKTGLVRTTGFGIAITLLFLAVSRMSLNCRLRNGQRVSAKADVQLSGLGESPYRSICKFSGIVCTDIRKANPPKARTRCAYLRFRLFAIRTAAAMEIAVKGLKVAMIGRKLFLLLSFIVSIN